MRYIASCSFGKDSLAMVLMLIEKRYPLDEVIFFNTGMEFKAIYNVRDRLVPIIKEHGITYTELEPRKPFYMICWRDRLKANKRASTTDTDGVVVLAVGEQQKN